LLRTPFGRLSKSLIAGVAAGALAISGLALTASPAGAVTTSRVGGANRYDTARLAALANFPGGSSTVILASGENFPDGLSASALAGAMGVPLLLTPTAALAAETVSALATLHAHTVQIVGGPSAVSAGVISQLQGLGYSVPTAIAGADRYATSAAVATAAAASAPVGTINGLKTAIIATGENFPDALSAGAAAYAKHLPILLTTTASLSPSVGPVVTALGIKNVLIMGGPSAVSAATETAIKALGVTTTRVAGATRFETAADMAQLAINPAFSGGLSMSASTIILASGLNFPDALVAAEFGAPIILNDTFPPASAAFLTANAALVNTIIAIGGTAVISDADLAAAASAVSPAGAAATFAAVAGGTSFTVTFGAPVNAAVGNFLINNTLIPGGLIQQTGAMSFLVHGWGAIHPALANPSALVPGDVIAINGGNPPTQVSNGAKVPVSSFTVPANAAPTVVATNFFIGGSFVSITFSKPIVSPAPGVATPAGVVFTHGAVNTSLTTPAPATSQDANTYTWALPSVVIAADTLTVNTTLTDQSGPPAVPFAARQVFSPVSNTVAPVIAQTVLSSAASAATPTTQGNIDFSGAPGVNEGAGAGTFIITAKPGSAADGAFGNGFVLATAGPIAGQAAVTVTTSTTTAGLAAGQTAVIIAYPAGVYGTGQALATALNANGVFNSILVASSVDTATPVTASGAVGSMPVLFGALGGGHAFYAVTAVLSKQVVPFGALIVPGNWVVKTNGAAALTAAVSLDNNAVPQAVTVVVLATAYTNVPLHGTSSLTWSGVGVPDFAGNIFAGATVTIS
jgi:putative cell wall-binding protein